MLNTIDETDFFEEAENQINYVMDLITCEAIQLDRSWLASELATAREYLKAHRLLSAEKTHGESPMCKITPFWQIGGDQAA